MSRASGITAIRQEGLRLLPIFVRFTGAGAIGTAAHYMVLVGLVSGFGSTGFGASVAGSIVGALINYAISYFWVFRSRQGHRYAFPRFFAVAALGLAVNAAVMYLLTSAASVHFLVAQLVATAFVLLVGFLLNAKWTFGRSR
jgi:putative flippase GtrA